LDLCWLYTGTTKQEALDKANIAIALVNAKCQELSGENWVMYAQELTAEPVIESVTYYYMFGAPPDQIVNGATCDLVAEFSHDWIIQEI